MERPNNTSNLYYIRFIDRTTDHIELFTIDINNSTYSISHEFLQMSFSLFSFNWKSYITIYILLPSYILNYPIWGISERYERRWVKRQRMMRWGLYEVGGLESSRAEKRKRDEEMDFRGKSPGMDRPRKSNKSKVKFTVGDLLER